MSESTPSGNRYEREPAKRVFSCEFREITYQFKDGTDDMSPSYVLLPTGERCNRVFIVGKLVEKKKSEGEQEFYQIQILDPTGKFFASAGSYQPEAMHQIAGIEIPNYVAVYGKPTLYQPPDGRVLVSIRAESVSRVDEETYNCWILDTAERTLERIHATEDTADKRKVAEVYPQKVEGLQKNILEALSKIAI